MRERPRSKREVSGKRNRDKRVHREMEMAKTGREAGRVRKRLGERERGKDQTVRNKDLIEKDKIRNQEIDGLQVTDKEKWGVVSNMVEKQSRIERTETNRYGYIVPP